MSIEKINKELNNDFFSIIIKNNTDEKIYDVELFNKNFKDLDKIHYDAAGQEVYQDILDKINQIGKGVYEIEKIYMTAFCDYSKFIKKQLDQKLRVVNEEDGINKRVVVCLDPYQQQPNIVLINGLGVELNTNLSLVLEHLMPDTTIQLNFFLKPI